MMFAPATMAFNQNQTKGYTNSIAAVSYTHLQRIQSFREIAAGITAVSGGRGAG